MIAWAHDELETHEKTLDELTNAYKSMRKRRNLRKTHCKKPEDKEESQLNCA